MATAKGRMLNRSISTSRKLSKVSDRAALIYSWTIPHTDDYGRMDGDSRMIKAVVVPLRDWTVEEVEGYLVELEECGVIERYTVEDEIYMEICFFEDHQTFRSDRARKAQFPNKKGVIEREDPYGKPVVEQEDTSGIPVVEKRPLSKVKISKVKSNKVTKHKGDPFGEYKNVFLTKEQYDRLLNHWFGGNQEMLTEIIFELSTYIASKGLENKYKDYSAVILSWAKRKHGESKMKQAAKGKDIVGL